MTELIERPAGRFAPVTLRAAGWALRAVFVTRRSLRRRGLATTVAPPPDLPWAAGRGVNAVLRRIKPTCLERSMVLQEWLRAHGDDRDVVVGVACGAGEFKAHAWVDSQIPALDAAGFRELYRITPR